MDLHLASDGRAAIDEAAGRLTPEAPDEGGTDWLVHDPWRPAPSVGGASGSPPGPVDRAAVDARSDVLTFTTGSRSESLTLAGAVVAELRLASDAVHFDVSCTLSRVTPAGQAFQVAEGYWSGPAPAAGEAVRIPLRATCVTLEPGERLRLSIAAAAFPAHPVNPGGGRRPEDASLDTARIITLGVRTGGEAGSRLIISVPCPKERA
jgi:putative CocE/NonD family hydrolase